EGGTDGADLAVHHAGRGDHVGTGGGLRDGDSLVELERWVIGDGLPREHAAMAVVGVLAQTEVRDQQSVGAECFSEVAQGTLDDTVLRPRLRALRILLHGDAEQHEAPHAHFQRGLGLARQRLDGILLLPAPRLDRVRFVDGVAHEQRIDQIFGRERGLSDEPAKRRPRAQPAGALRRKGHAGIGVRLRTMASTSPRVVYSCAMISTRSPRSRAVCAAIGPMQAILTRSDGGSGMAPTKWRTVDELVNVITSTPTRQAASRGRRSAGGTAR